MPTTPPFKEVFAQSLRAHRVLRQLMQKEKYKNLYRLLAAIKEANLQAHSNCKIGRTALENFINIPAEAGLTIENMAALHVFLRTFGEGFDQHCFVEKSGILDWLSRSRSLACLLASKPSHKQEYISSWDFKSTLELRTSLTSMGAKFKHGNDDVLVPTRKPMDPVQEQKINNLLQGEIVSLISVGSPLACLSTEMILARMFGVRPFDKPTAARPMPFYFVWPPHYTQHLQSSFVLSADDLPCAELAGRVQNRKASALKIDGTFLEVPIGERRYTLYGILAAQKRRNDHVWVVLAGLSGPATLAAAIKAKEVPLALPSVQGKNSPILWAVVEADILHTDPGDDGDGRIIEDCRLGDARIWSVEE